MEKVYIYDFDKTIYDGDSSINFFLFCLRKKFKLLKYIPAIIYYFILHTLKIISTKEFKEHFFSFLKEFENIDEMVRLFWNKNKNKIYNFFNEILDIEGRPTIYIISASPKFLLEGYVNNLKKVKLIATDMDKKTGKIKGENCKGIEKLNQLPKNIKIEKYYSDSHSDRFLEEKSKKSYIVCNGKIEEWTDEKFKKKKDNKIAFLIFLFFFTIYLILGVHLTYIYSVETKMDIIFGLDIGRVLDDMTDIFAPHKRIKVHPLFVLITSPFVLILKGISHNATIAAIIFSAFISAFTISLMYKITTIFIKNNVSKIIISLIFGFSFTNIIFGSVAETYNIAGLFFILLWLLTILIFKKEKATNLDLIYLCILGILSISITVTNVIAFLIILFMLLISKKINLKKAILIGITIIISSILLSHLQNFIWRNTPILGLSTDNYISEKNYIDFEINKDRTLNLIKNGYINSIISSSVILNEKESIAFKNVDILSLIFTCLFYLIIVAFFIKNFKKNRILNVTILLSIFYNFILHMFYGNSQIFIYTCHFIFLPFLLCIINFEEIKKIKFINILLFTILIIEVIKNAINFKQVLYIVSPLTNKDNYYRNFSNPNRMIAILLIILLIYTFCYLFYKYFKKILFSKDNNKLCLYIVYCILSILSISLIFIFIQTISHYNVLNLI